ncbi:MAG TPA: hypothetical protein VLM76_10080, partial [Patescibacteria group bacterium]|nr:hypothetical protein [Patescibacteria group bacterium]
MARNPIDPTRLRRTIRFHRIHVMPDQRPRIPYDPGPLLAGLRALLPTGDRYLEQGERITLCLPDHDGPPAHLRIVNIRRRDLPQVEAAGVLSPLGIGRTAGLADQIHLVFFADNVVGSEFNYYGPRVTRLADVVRAKRIGPEIELRDLVRENVIARLDAMTDVTAATLTVDRSAIEVARQSDATLARALDETAEFAERGVIEITVRRRPHSRETLSDRVRSVWRALARRPDAQEGLRGLRIEGRNPATGELETLDLLGQALMTSRRILRTQPGSRVLDSADAYAEIASAHDELSDEIR